MGFQLSLLSQRKMNKGYKTPTHLLHHHQLAGDLSYTVHTEHKHSSPFLSFILLQGKVLSCQLPWCQPLSDVGLLFFPGRPHASLPVYHSFTNPGFCFPLLCNLGSQIMTSPSKLSEVSALTDLNSPVSIRVCL